VCSGMSGRERISWSLPFGLATTHKVHKAAGGCCRRLSDFCSTMRAVHIGRSPTSRRRRPAGFQCAVRAAGRPPRGDVR
jgi:hypothetical protein